MISVWTVGDLIVFSIYILIALFLQIGGVVARYRLFNKKEKVHDLLLANVIDYEDFEIRLKKVNKKIHISKILTWIGFGLGLCCYFFNLCLSFWINF